MECQVKDEGLIVQPHVRWDILELLFLYPVVVSKGQ